VALNVFGLFLVDARHGIAGATLRVEQFIKLGMYGLGVSMLCSLNEQGHEPNGHGSEAVPTKGLTIQQEPQEAVSHDEEECPRVGRKDTELRKATAD
jgi:hypothetical protein